MSLQGKDLLWIKVKYLDFYHKAGSRPLFGHFVLHLNVIRLGNRHILWATGHTIHRMKKYQSDLDLDPITLVP